MIRILNATLRNFMTIGEITQSIDLSIDGLTLVLGENLDIGGANSRNGCGKTAILQAICYVLFGKPLTKIRLDNLVNSLNSKDMLITMEFEANGKSYRIERGRKPAVLRFFKDGVAQKLDEAQGENKRTQAEIERILGLSYKLFRHIVALNTSTLPFLREEAEVQREVIEELFGIAQLSQRADALKKLIEVTKEQVRDADATAKATSEANGRIEQAIGLAQSDAETWKTAQQHRIVHLMTQAESMHAIDIDAEIAVFDRLDHWTQQQGEIVGRRQTAERQIATLAQEISRLRSDVLRYETEAQSAESGEIMRLERQAQRYRTEANQDVQPQIDRLHAEVVRRQQEASSQYAEANRLDIELDTLHKQLAHPDAHACSTCGQGLAGTDHLATVMAKLSQQQQAVSDRVVWLLSDHDRALAEAAAAEAEIAQLAQVAQQRRDDLLAKVAALSEDIDRAQAELQDKQKLAQQQADQLLAKIDDLLHQKKLASDQIDALPELGPAPVSAYASRDALWQLRQDRDLLLNRLETEIAKPNPNDAKLDGLRSTLVLVDYTELNEFTYRLKHETFLHKLLTAKESFIRKKIIDQNLKYLNKRLDHYLQRLGLPHEVAFQADLTVEIVLLGAEFDFEQLSRGEMNRVILATSWAFRDVWENLNTTLSLLFVDEMLDQGTDGAGVEAALDILAQMAGERHKSIFLVSHRDELRDRIDNVLLVRKENQFTSFA